MRRILVGVALVSWCSFVASAQTPNFSGTWVVDQELTREAAREDLQARAGTVGGGGRGGRGGGGVGGGVGAARGGVVMGAGVANSTGTGTSAGLAGRRGGRGSAGGGIANVSTDVVITMDTSTFTVEIGGRPTSYSLDGSETIVGTARSRATWQGSRLVITTSRELDGSTATQTTTWSLTGDVLLRETPRKTFYQRK